MYVSCLSNTKSLCNDSCETIIYLLTYLLTYLHVQNTVISTSSSSSSSTNLIATQVLQKLQGRWTNNTTYLIYTIAYVMQMADFGRMHFSLLVECWERWDGVILCMCVRLLQYGGANSAPSSARADTTSRDQSRPRDSSWNCGAARQHRLSRNTQTVAALRRYPVRSLGQLCCRF